MIYQWRCAECGAEASVTRPVEERGSPPDWALTCPLRQGDSAHSWVRVYTAPAGHLSQAWRGPGSKGNP